MIIPDRFQPSFSRFPINNNRTGFQPVNLPLILTVPFRRTADGIPFNDSAIKSLRFLIEDTPGKRPVAGFQNKGIFVPDFERFILNISDIQLSEVQINLEGRQFYDKDTGSPKSFEDAIEGDLFEYTLIRGVVPGPGARDRITFYPDADYFDLSNFTIETIELRPFGRYNFVYEVTYNTRISTPQGEIFCISEDEGIDRFSLLMAHPGEVHEAMINSSPSVYFDGQPFDKDQYVKFLRPFADMLQDIFDEQEFIEGINHVESIPAQLIPYLSFLLGWDLPFFPGATDKIRRSILKNARRLQSLKGSKRALIELFEIFGFTIDIINLWHRTDGEALIAPGEPQPFKFRDEEIKIEETCQTDPLLNNYSTPGFGELDIPLLFRPKNDIIIDTWIVRVDSQTHMDLIDLLDDINMNPEGLSAKTCAIDSNGFLTAQSLESLISSSSIGFSRVRINTKNNKLDEVSKKETPVSLSGVNYDIDTNILSLVFDHSLDLGDEFRVYSFATYIHDKVIVPPKLTDLRSNRFDIEILFKTGEQPTSEVYEFLLDFIFRLKAFHSLLRKIIFVQKILDVYNVQDWCVGGRVSLDALLDAGNLFRPPPLTPLDVTKCNVEQFTRGADDSLLGLRADILAGLEQEHEAWKVLDGTHEIPDNLGPILDSLSRINPNVRDDPPCELTQHGQDRVFDLKENNIPRKDFDHIQDTRDKLCDLEGNTIDYCYKGRVEQTIDEDRILSLPERERCKPCELMLGLGFYYTAAPVDENLGTFGISRCTTETSHLSRMHLLFSRVKGYEDPTLHYTDRHGFRSDLLDTNDFFAIRRPSLEIDKDNLFFPGHRFISMNKIKNDFISTDYNFRPWDFIFQLCSEDVPDGAPTFEDLEFMITTDTNGDEFLVFNSIPYQEFGNDLEPDISSLGTHDPRDFTVTHSIFSTSSPGFGTSDGFAIEHDSLVFTDEESICLTDFGPIFKSANRNCACDSGTEQGADFIDGYPAEVNEYSVDISEFNHSRDATDIDAILDILLPPTELDTSVELLFKLGSGILLEKDDIEYRHYIPHRLDCGCEFFECESTGPSITRVDRCHIERFLEDDEPEVSCDKVDIDRNMMLVEEFGACSILLDGTIPNLICFDADKIGLELDEKLPPSGEFFFIDDYGIIHKASFVVSRNKIDITLTTKDPRVPGESPQGFIENFKTFRRGVITTTRQVVEAITNGSNVNAEVSSSKIDFFRTTFGCGDDLPSNPFAFGINCCITDDVEFIIGTGAVT